MVNINKVTSQGYDPKVIGCLQRLSKFHPQPYTKFVLTKPDRKNKKWDVRSYVDYELAEDDASIVIMLKKGLSVSESNYALWSVAVLLKKAAEEAKAAKKKLEKQVARKTGGITLLEYWIKKMNKYLVDVGRRVFNSPTELYYMIQRFFQRRK